MMMARVTLIALCSVCLLLNSAVSLKCRTGVEQADDQYQKIIQVCKKRSTTDDNYSDDSSSTEDEGDNSSSVDVFGTKFFVSNSNNFLNTQSGKDSNDYRNHRNDRKNGNGQHSSNHTDGNWRNTENSNRGSNNHDFNYFNGIARSSYDQMYNSNSENYDKEREQAVDQRGFPDQNSVIQLMTHNIHNPELQDFIEEVIIECSHYLGSDMRQDKCYYSQNLLICLIDKGKERCEDWNN